MNLLRDRSVLASTLAAVAISALTSSHTLAQSAAQQPEEETRVESRAGAVHTLRTHVTLRANEVALRDVLEFFESVTPIRFEPMWVDGERVGLDPEALVTLDLEKRPLREAIERLLEQLRDDLDSTEWQIGDDGKVQIGPKSILNERTEIVFYDLNDILLELPVFGDPPEIDLQSAMQQNQGSSPPPFRESGESESLKSNLGDANEIADIVTMLVDPDQWHRNGGEGAIMRVWKNQLVVKAPRYILRGIDGLH